MTIDWWASLDEISQAYVKGLIGQAEKRTDVNSEVAEPQPAAEGDLSQRQRRGTEQGKAGVLRPERRRYRSGEHVSGNTTARK